MPLNIDRPEWQQRSACHGEDGDLFFPERGASTAPAKQICARCPVRGDCLAYALEEGIYNGIWGGYSERERRKMRRRSGGRARWRDPTGLEPAERMTEIDEGEPA